MSPERIETAENYLRLCERYQKKLAARAALVNLPEEVGKGYAKKYHKDKDTERLGNYIHSLMREYRKHIEKHLSSPR
jgi:hypothetical protein